MIQSQYKRVLGNRTEYTHLQSSKVSTSQQPNFLPGNVKGKDLFDSVIWKDPLSTSVFYKFTAALRRKIRGDIEHTTPTHRFIRTLRDSRKLVRCYTQNIDGLESREGLCMNLGRGKGNRARFTKKVMEKPKEPTHSLSNGEQDGGCEVVQLHGDLEELRCNLCQQTCGWEGKGTETLLLDGTAPECLSCAVSDQQRRNQGKRGTKVGTLRPNIVLYGEEHPSADILGTIIAHDLGLAPDLLLILGTSLHVHGLKILVREFAKSVLARPGGKGKVICVNLSKPSECIWKDTIDYWISMDCDKWIGALRRHRPDLWQIQMGLKLQVSKQNTKIARHAVIKKQILVDTREEKENTRNTLQKVWSPKVVRPLPQIRRRKPLEDTISNALGGSSAMACDTNSPIVKFDTTESLQLPTPPPSGHRARFQAVEKRLMPLDNESASPTTPSKRARIGSGIWEDDELTSARHVRIDHMDRKKVGGRRKSPESELTDKVLRPETMAKNLVSLR